ncbi:unnamed protein product, partial [Prunus brigantina]
MNGSCLQPITTPRKACFWFLVLDPLHVVLSLAFIVRVLEKRSRLDGTCMVESNPSKHGRARSAFGIVKHGGVTPINLGKSRPPL